MQQTFSMYAQNFRGTQELALFRMAYFYVAEQWMTIKLDTRKMSEAI